jgi:hypothetical protein
VIIGTITSVVTHPIDVGTVIVVSAQTGLTVNTTNAHTISNTLFIIFLLVGAFLDVRAAEQFKQASYVFCTLTNEVILFIFAANHHLLLSPLTQTLRERELTGVGM